MGSVGVEQFDAKMALDGLSRQVPRDAYGLMAVTMHDLYPKPEWNFVYGLARLTERVGIFSFVRHTPGEAPPAWRGAQLLHRSVKTMLHEIGHMFGMKHCTFFNCMMRGSNGEEVEHQKNHLHLCPVCLRKLHWNIGFDIREHYAGLLDVIEEYEDVNEYFKHDVSFLRRRIAKLDALPAGITMMSDPRQAAAPKRAAASARTASAPRQVASGSRPSSANSTALAQAGRSTVESTAKAGERVARLRTGSTPAPKSLATRNGSKEASAAVDTSCECCVPGKGAGKGLTKGAKRGKGFGARTFDAAKANNFLEELQWRVSDEPAPTVPR